MIRDLSQISVMMVEDDETTRNVIKNSLLKNKINVVFDTAFVKDALNFVNSAVSICSNYFAKNSDDNEKTLIHVK